MGKGVGVGEVRGLRVRPGRRLGQGLRRGLKRRLGERLGIEAGAG